VCDRSRGDKAGAKLELTCWTRRPAWTNSRTHWHLVVPRHTQQTTGVGFLIRRLDAALTSHPLRGKDWKHVPPAREDNAGDILQRYTWISWTGWTNSKT
jgi:hypothetical protein